MGRSVEPRPAVTARRRCRAREPSGDHSHRPWTNSMASARVRGSSRNSPRTAEVMVRVPGLRTPRIDMQRCSASTTTSTPRGSSTLSHRVGDLRRHALLHLQPVGEGVDQTGQLRQPGDPAVVTGNVAHVGLAHEGDHVVLAQRGEGDVAHEDHLVVLGRERHREVAPGIVVVAGEQFLVHRRHPPRRGQETLATGILPDGGQQLGHQPLHPLDIDAHGASPSPCICDRHS